MQRRSPSMRPARANGNPSRSRWKKPIMSCLSGRAARSVDRTEHLAPGAQRGFGFTGGGGDFGTRFGWYVDTVRRKVSDNWLKYEIDPRIGEARRVYLVFDITRDGHPSHIEVEQSSGVPSLGQSAVRALQRIDTFGPLPSDYSGNKVSVEFWFDYKR